MARLGPHSALTRERDPDHYGWDVAAHIAAAGVNTYGYAHGVKGPIVLTPSDRVEQRAKDARFAARARALRDEQRGDR